MSEKRIRRIALAAGVIYLGIAFTLRDGTWPIMGGGDGVFLRGVAVVVFLCIAVAPEWPE